MVSTRRRRLALVAAGLPLCLALAACSGGSKGPGLPATSTTAGPGKGPAHGVSAPQMVTAKDGAKDDYFGGDYYYNTFATPVAPLYYASPGEVSMSADGKFAVVGAPGHAQSGELGAGAAYVFAQTNGHWAQQAELVLADHHQYDGFGWAVTMSDDGTTVLASAPYHSSPGKSQDGGVWVFHRTGVTWAQVGQLQPPDVVSYDSFGWSLAISGDTAPYTVLVGSPSHALGGAKRAGVVYAFSGSGATWALKSEIPSPDGAAEGGFGTALALSRGGAVALMTKFDHPDSTKTHRIGALYVFKTASGWANSKLVETFQDPNRNADGTPDAYGTDVGISADGRTAMVAAPDVAVGPLLGAGALYVYTTGPSVWDSPNDNHTATITEPVPQANGYYGSTVEVDAHGTTAVVGADDIGSNAQGGLYVLRAAPAGANRWSAASVKQTKIPSPDLKGPGRLGTDVGMSVDGKTIVGTAPWVTVGGRQHQGVAYFFTLR